MRLLNWIEFSELPKGTLFRKYEPDCFEGLCIKGATINHNGIPADFFLTYLDNHDGYVHHEGGFKFDYDIQGRDALFDKDQLFVVYEDDDINYLIKVLSLAKGKFYPKQEKDRLLEELYQTTLKFNDNKFRLLQPWTTEHREEYEKLSKAQKEILEKEHSDLDEKGKRLTAELEKIGVSFDEQLEYNRSRGK